MRGDQAVNEVKRALSDPVRVAERLGLAKGSQRQAGGLIVCCPVHGDRTPSCSLTRGPDGTLRVKCFGCDFAGTVLHLLAAVHKLEIRRDFKLVLLEGATLAGLTELASELAGGHEHAPRDLPPQAELPPDRDYPPADEVRQLWESAVPVEQDEPSQVMLALRGLFPGSDLARAVQGTLPRWASYQGHTWGSTGHRVILPVYDPTGQMRSVRAWQVHKVEGPKRLPPAGCKAAGLVLANPPALRWLLEPGPPIALVIVEGEGDYLAACQTTPSEPVVGVGSGSWTQAAADRVPIGSAVAIHTHHDPAGDRYAAEITKTLAKHVRIKRGRI